MKILTYPNQILTAKAQEIDLADFDIKKLQKLIKNIIKIMHKHGGVGLAAPQVGKSLRISVINKKAGGLTDDLILINPVIISGSLETDIRQEGCLSLPGVQIKIERTKWIKVKAIDLNGNAFYLEARDLLARVIQHEIDHLDGVLITDK